MHRTPRCSHTYAPRVQSRRRSRCGVPCSAIDRGYRLLWNILRACLDRLRRGLGWQSGPLHTLGKQRLMAALLPPAAPSLARARVV